MSDRAGQITAPGRDLVFYDGACGLCHHAVRFTLARDRDGSRFRYAPLAGSTFLATYDAATRQDLPDSIVVRTADGRTLSRSAAMLHLAERVGGGWRLLAWLAGLFPRWLLDLAYDGVARVRHRLFRRPAEACPMIPPELRTRFDA